MQAYKKFKTLLRLCIQFLILKMFSNNIIRWTPYCRVRAATAEGLGGGDPIMKPYAAVAEIENTIEHYIEIVRSNRTCHIVAFGLGPLK